MISICQSGFISWGWVLASVLWLFTLAVQATPIEANTASSPELESIKGIGPRMAANISTERRNANFSDWTDLIERVQGIGPGSALKFSNHGLTVNGAQYSATPTTSITATTTSRKPHHTTLNSGRGIIMTIPQASVTPPQPAPRTHNTNLSKTAPRPAKISQAP